MRSVFYGVRVMLMLVRYSFRFFAGRPMSGERKTDATFFRPATRSLDPSGTMLRWERMRGASRAAWRMGVLYVLMLMLALMLLKLTGVLVSASGHELPALIRPGAVLVAHLALIGLALAAYVSIKGNIEHGYRYPLPVRVLDLENERNRWALRWVVKHGRLEWERARVIPVANALTSMLSQGTMTPAKARRLVSVPRSFRVPGGEPIVVSLPAEFTGADAAVSKRLVSTVKARLAIREEVEASWQLEGAHPRVLISVPEMPPALITFADVSTYLDAIADEHTFFHGLVSGGAALMTSLSGDSPHSAVSAGSGAGKSELIKLKIMQALHRGWSVIVMDWKTESQQWCKGLPGVRYVTTEETIHDMCMAIDEEIEHRKTHPGEERARVLVVAEEWGITAPLLYDYWQGLREPSDPKRSPALIAMMKLVFCGRSLGMFEELCAQRFSARVTNGNADLRESFQTIHMARWKTQTVKMLAPDVKPFPRNSKQPGRWVAVIGDEAQVYQAPLITDEEAREYALSGKENPASPWALRGGATGVAQRETLRDLQDRLPHEAAGGSSIDLALEGEVLTRVDARKLMDMVDALEPLGITEKILRNARDRDPVFPQPWGGNQFSGYTYVYEDVKEWAKRRHARMALERMER